MTLTIENLHAGYGRLPVLHGINLGPIAPGQFVGVIGPNASGKSTLFRTIAGLQRPMSGRVKLGADDLGGLCRQLRGRRVAYMPQAFGCNAVLTVFESVLLARKQMTGWRVDARDLHEVARTLAALRLSHLADRGIAQLSGGQAQMVAGHRCWCAIQPSCCWTSRPARSTCTTSFRPSALSGARCRPVAAS
ncbi:ABC transporter ATP-binding protein [Paracoccus sp. S-4012]|uniref:ABC transporter ATP-binding protein n=1 Tax=Paracoccus sp. S-4012 TaxID=2665648 RepID=UPI001E4A2E9E|nr:ABC transporter ATP-binding protein [Paracoccus sp. S-4012]